MKKTNSLAHGRSRGARNLGQALPEFPAPGSRGLEAVGLVAMAPAAAVPCNEQTEGVEIKSGADRKQTFTPDGRKFTVVKFVPDGQDVDNWKEMVTIRNLGSLGRKKNTPQQGSMRGSPFKRRNVPAPRHGQ